MSLPPLPEPWLDKGDDDWLNPEVQPPLAIVAPGRRAAGRSAWAIPRTADYQLARAWGDANSVFFSGTRDAVIAYAQLYLANMGDT